VQGIRIKLSNMKYYEIRKDLSTEHYFLKERDGPDLLESANFYSFCSSLIDHLQASNHAASVKVGWVGGKTLQSAPSMPPEESLLVEKVVGLYNSVR
jgi:hypothetical protein